MHLSAGKDSWIYLEKSVYIMYMHGRALCMCGRWSLVSSPSSTTKQPLLELLMISHSDFLPDGTADGQLDGAPKLLFSCTQF